MTTGTKSQFVYPETNLMDWMQQTSPVVPVFKLGK